MEDILYQVKLAALTKNKLLSELSNIFAYSSESDKKQELTGAIGNSVYLLLLLSRRYGITYESVEQSIMDCIHGGLIEYAGSESISSDLRDLAKYLRGE